MQNVQILNICHLYWGLDRENIVLDNPNFKCPWDRTVEKYGYEEACRKNARGDKSAGGRGNKGKPKSEEHKKKIAESLKNKQKFASVA